MYCDNLFMIIDKRNFKKWEENHMTEVKKNTFNIFFNANGTFNNILLTTIPNAVQNITNQQLYSLFIQM